MNSRSIIYLAALLLASAGCKNDSSESAPDAPGTAPVATVAKPLQFGPDNELSLRGAIQFAQEWFNAYGAHDWARLNASLAPGAEIILEDKHTTQRISPDVWKSLMGAKAADASNRPNDKTRPTLRTDDEIAFTEFDGGAFFRADVVASSASDQGPGQSWEFVIRVIDGTPKVWQVRQRRPRLSLESPRTPQLGALMVSNGLVLEPNSTTEAERGFRTLLTADGLAELWVDKNKIADSHRRLEGTAFEVFDASGTSCSTKLGGFRYYAQATPPLWLEEDWTSKLGDKNGSRAAGEAVFTIAGSSSRSLVGVLDKTGLQECPDPIWGRAQTTTPLSRYELGDTKELAEDAIGQFEEIPVVRSLQRNHERLGGNDPWFNLGVAPIVKAFETDGRQFVTVSASAGTTCNDFVASAFAVWEIKEGKWSLMTPPEGPTLDFVPESAADIDGDGMPEFFAKGVMVRYLNGAFRVAQDIRPVSLEGGC